MSEGEFIFWCVFFAVFLTINPLILAGCNWLAERIWDALGGK